MNIFEIHGLKINILKVYTGTKMKLKPKYRDQNVIFEF